MAVLEPSVLLRTTTRRSTTGVRPSLSSDRRAASALASGSASMSPPTLPTVAPRAAWSMGRSPSVT